MRRLTIGLLAGAAGLFAAAQETAPAACIAEASGQTSGGAILKVAVPAGTRLQAGDEVTGRLSQGLFSGSREVASAGETVRFAIDRAWKERAPGSRKSVWSWILRPLDFPARNTFIESSAAVLAGGKMLGVSVLRVSKGKKGQRIVWLKPAAVHDEGAPVHPAFTAGTSIPAGTRLRAVLVTPLHSSLSPEGAPVRAVLTAPVPVPSAEGEGALRMIPAGTEISGRVARARGARWLSRPGRLAVTFQRIAMPCGGASAELSAAVTSLDPDEATGLRVDREGAISGGPQGKLKTLLHIGASYAIGKLTDDLIEEGVKGAAGLAAGSAASVARYPSIGVGLFLFAMQRGREVTLPAYQEVEITLNRAVELR
ncbi:MAG: hypothetical protein R2762_13200 [Bryobacteraceae bacterium]